MDDLVRRIRLDAFASCAWQDAVDPIHSAGLRAIFGGGEAVTIEDVERQLGAEAAQAWRDAVDARERFFSTARQGATDGPSV